MTNQNERLARALEALHLVQQDGIVRSSSLSQTYRERLVKAGFLQEVMNGWLVVAHPGAPDGSSVTWYGAFWSFLSQYLQSRFGDGYCLSAETSVKRHVRSTLIPRQVAVVTQGNTYQTIRLPFEASLLIYPTKDPLPPNRVQLDGVQTMDLPLAISRLAAPFYKTDRDDAEIALRMIRNSGVLLQELLRGSNVIVAGRLVGAYTFLGETRMAMEIKETMEAAGNHVRISNPFDQSEPMLMGHPRITSPHVARLEALWSGMRTEIMNAFCNCQKRNMGAADYLAEMEELYTADAYNSLSIEGYRVSPELIERVRTRGWDPEKSDADRNEKNAFAARGYYQAFQSVKASVAKILGGAKDFDVIEHDFQVWYREMFSPAVVAGLLDASQLAGYRNTPVYLRGSRYVPPAAAAVADCMDALFGLLRTEPDPLVRAVLGHFIFVYIHPYPDGNGRIGRFLMNAALASGGYPWTVVRQTRRDPYLKALEEASTKQNILPLASFILEEMMATSATAFD